MSEEHDTSGGTEYTRTAKEFIKWIGDIEKVPFDTYDQARAALVEAVHHLRYCERANVADEYRIFHLANRVADLEQWEREAVETLAPLTGTTPPYTLSDVVADVAAIIQENGLYKFAPPESGEREALTCPTCGSDGVTKDASLSITYDCGKCGRWSEDQLGVMRIRALEADLKAAREETGVQWHESNDDYSALEADNARLQAEVERLRGEMMTEKERCDNAAQCYEELALAMNPSAGPMKHQDIVAEASALVPSETIEKLSNRIRDFWRKAKGKVKDHIETFGEWEYEAAELEDRIAAANERVKALEPVICVNCGSDLTLKNEIGFVECKQCGHCWRMTAHARNDNGGVR